MPGPKKGSKLAGWRPLKWTDAQYDRVIEILRDNPDKTERWIFTNLIGADLPGRLSVQQRRRKDPSYLAKTKAILSGRPKRIKPMVTEKQRAAWDAKRIHEVVTSVPRPAGQLRRGLLAIEAFATADRAISRALQLADREDARSDLVEALLRGAVGAAQASKAGRGFAAMAGRMHKRIGFLSLDARTMGDDESPAYVDTFTTCEAHGW